jgi:hypothetical protein
MGVTTLAARYKGETFFVQVAAKQVRDYLASMIKYVEQNELRRSHARHCVVRTFIDKEHADGCVVAWTILYLACTDEDGEQDEKATEIARRGGWTIGLDIIGKSFELIAAPSDAHPFGFPDLETMGSA